MQPSSYLERLRAELAELHRRYGEVLDASAIHNVDPNRRGSGIVFFHAVQWDWVPSDAEHEGDRMALLGPLRAWIVRFRLFRRGRRRAGPAAGHAAVGPVRGPARGRHQHLGRQPRPRGVRVPARARVHGGRAAGGLRELDDLKRRGRSAELREAAKRADRRLKGLRDNGDVQAGVRVAGDVYAVFDHQEPARDGLPGWLDFDVPDDRLIAAVLRLQSDHPGSVLYVATGDLNLQTKLAAVGLPFVELPEGP